MIAALVLRWERRPRTLPAHKRGHTSIVANSHRVRRLQADERAAFIGLQLNDVDIAQQQPVIEARGSCRGSLEPSPRGWCGNGPSLGRSQKC